MKAAICYEFGQPLKVEDVVLDPPKQGEVRIKISACAICHSDIIYIDGGWGGTLPAVYGHEAAGTVTEIGPGVTQVKEGDHVVVSLVRKCGTCYFCTQGQSHLCEGNFPIDSDGGRLRKPDGQPLVQGLRTAGFAEEVVVDQSQLVIVPDEMSSASASLLACGVITGLGAVTNTAQIPAGSTVAVIGCGGVGLNSIQGAAISGARMVFGIDLVDEKLEAAKKFGATHGINSKTDDPVAAVREATDGRGVDYVFVTVGVGSVINQGLSMLRNRGMIVLVGMPASGVKTAIEVANFAGLEQMIMGSKMGSTNLSVDIPKLVELYEQGRLKLDELVTAEYPLEEINEAIAAVKSGSALRNVIVF